MNPVRFVRISENLHEELTEKLSDGHSAVLLGPRYIGKRRVLREIEKRLKGRFGRSVVSIYRTDSADGSAQPLERLMAQAVRTSYPDAPESPPGGAFGALDWAVEQHGMQILFVSNADTLEQQEIQELLRGIRTRVEARKIAAVVGGELK